MFTCVADKLGGGKVFSLFYLILFFGTSFSSLKIMNHIYIPVLLLTPQIKKESMSKSFV